GNPRPSWYTDVTVPSATEGGRAWSVGGSDRFIALRLDGKGAEDLIATNGLSLAIIASTGADARDLRVVWTAGSTVFDWTRGETPILRRGRTFPDGKESLFIVSSSALVEILGPSSAPV